MMAILAMVAVGFASSGASHESASAQPEIIATTASTSTTAHDDPERLTARVHEARLAAFYAEVERQESERRFYAEIERQKEEQRQREESERRRAEEAARTTTTTTTTTTLTPTATAPPPAAGPSTGRCGGDLPPCSIMQRESGGDPRIWNGVCYAPTGWTGNSPCGSSSASGKWQFVRGTWAGFGGYLNAADAPESVQDAKARQVWAGGRGCSHWDAC